MKIAPKDLDLADMVVCLPGSKSQYFDDDVITKCEECLQTIHHRPYMPKTVKKVCIDCAIKLNK